MDALTIEANTPTLLLVFPEPWLEVRSLEWGQLSEAAGRAGFTVAITHWDALDNEGSVVRARGSRLRHPGAASIQRGVDVALTPTVLLTTWGVDQGYRDIFDDIVTRSRCYHKESPTLARLDDKSELERCLRRYEARGGQRIPRPRTVLSEEVSNQDSEPGDERVIVKPSRGGQRRGVEIVDRGDIADMAREATAGVREPFVIQELVGDTFLYEGRRWVLRIHAMAMSLSPLEYRLYREGDATTMQADATADGALPDEWLNPETSSEGIPQSEALRMSEMLRYIEREHYPLKAFWDRADDLVGHLFASMAEYQAEEQSGYAAEERRWIDRAVLYPGLDLLVERHGTDDYQLKLLEVNSHPGLGRPPHLRAAMVSYYQAWFEDLWNLAVGDRDIA